MERISLIDLANALNVSPTLVSLVLNGKGGKHGISKKTQALVLEKAKELKYFPNQMARGLRAGKSGTIGLVISDIANSYYSVLARRIEDESIKAGYTLIVCSTDEDEHKELLLLNMLQSRRVEGIILLSALQDPEPINVMRHFGLPIVLIERNMPGADTPAVLVNNYDSAFNLTNIVVSQGHKNIGYLSFDHINNSTLRDRLEGYNDAIKGAGIQSSQSKVVQFNCENFKESIENALPKLLEGQFPVTALVVATSNIAVAVLQVAKGLGLNIPNDISLCSLDDADLFQLIEPSVTACAYPIDEIADTAMRLLKNQMVLSSAENTIGVERIVLNPLLHIRSSIAQIA